MATGWALRRFGAVRVARGWRMTKAELIERVYRTKGLPNEATKKMVAQIIEATFTTLGDHFVKAKVTRRSQPKLTYPRFGTFTKKRRGQRRGRNPQSGEIIVEHTLPLLRQAPSRSDSTS